MERLEGAIKVNMDAYKYVTNNNLEQRQNYMYSEYGGEDFLVLYKKNRESYLKYCLIDDNLGGTDHITIIELHEVKKLIANGFMGKAKDSLDNYIKKFEVSKRLYTEYNYDWKIKEDSEYEEIDPYLLLSECCLLAYKDSGCLKYYSCLLKLNDTLISVQNRMTLFQKMLLKEIIVNELDEFDKLANKVGVVLK